MATRNKDQGNSIIMGNRTDGMLKRVLNKNPSEIMDLQPGVRLKDKLAQKIGGEFTQTLRGHMSRDDYRGISGTHRIVPPTQQQTHRQHHEEPLQQTSSSRAKYQIKKNTRQEDNESLSTIYGEPDHLQTKKKISRERLIIPQSKKKEQIKDMLYFDKGQLWNVSKLKLTGLHLPLDPIDSNYTSANPKTANLNSARNNTATPFDYAFNST